MNPYQVVRELAKSKNMTISSLEQELGFGNGNLARWAKSAPNSTNLLKVADYFGVTVDYILGRGEKKYYDLNQRDLKDIEKSMEALREDMSNGQGIHYYGEPVSNESVSLILDALELGLKHAKMKAKKKFTPKKYRN